MANHSEAHTLSAPRKPFRRQLALLISFCDDPQRRVKGQRFSIPSVMSLSAGSLQRFPMRGADYRSSQCTRIIKLLITLSQLLLVPRDTARALSRMTSSRTIKKPRRSLSRPKSLLFSSRSLSRIANRARKKCPNCQKCPRILPEEAQLRA